MTGTVEESQQSLGEVVGALLQRGAVPVVLGGKGVEKILEITLTLDEKAMLEKSASSVKTIVDVVKKN